MTYRARRLSAAATLVALIVVGAVLSPVATRPAAAGLRGPVRVAGDDRYVTAVELTRLAFPSGAPTVFVVSGETFPDALAGGAVAAATRMPLLLTGAAAAPDVVLGELDRLSPTKVVVLGGPSAVSDTVLAQIAAAVGVMPERVAGPTRYDTAAGVAAWFSTGGTVFVATGTAFADGLAGGPAAGVARGPLLLVEPNAVPASTSAQLTRLQPSRIVVLGGPAAVSDAVLGSLSAFSTNVSRMAGADRFGTAAAIAQEFFPDPDEAWLASGIAFPDALAAGSLAAQYNAPLLLTLPACVPPATIGSLQSHRWPNVTVIGGWSAVSEAGTSVLPCSPVPDGPIGPGVRLDTIVTEGPNVVRIITIDRAQGVDIRSTLASGQLVGRLPTTEIARRWNALVAVNGDFFLSDGQPSHAFATGGRMLKAPALIEDQTGFSAMDPRVAYSGTPGLQMVAVVQETGASATINRFNDGAPDANELAVYTPEGAGAGAPPPNVCAARLSTAAAPQLIPSGSASQSHVVAAHGCGGGAPPAGTDDLLVADASGSRAAFVASLTSGQHVTIGWRVHPQWQNLLDTTGSNTTLVHDGVPSEDVVFGTGPFYGAAAPRTAVGQLSDGRDVLVTVDGRQPGYSVGVTPIQLAEILVAIGVKEAANLDGGGSTSLAVGGVLVNRPSDQSGERPVGTALVVVPAGTVDPPRFAWLPGQAAFADAFAEGGRAPAFDLALATDAGSIGGYAATLAASGTTLSPELAAIARAFNARSGP